VEASLILVNVAVTAKRQVGVESSSPIGGAEKTGGDTVMRTKLSIVVTLLLLLGAVMATASSATPASAAGTAPPFILPCNDQPEPTFDGELFVPDPLPANTIVLACPAAHWTWGWVTGTVYLNRHETNLISTGTSLTAILGPLGAITMGAAAAFGGLGQYFAYVYRAGHCVKFKIYPGFPPPVTPGEYWGTSGGGYCR
jgi:hypothetical protein